jgi:outer membrane protein
MNIKLSAALVGGIMALAGAQPAFAQAVPAPKIAVVDLNRISRECNACKVAAATLQQQAAAFEARRQQFAQQFQPEGQYLQTAVNALNGKQPDAALAARIRAFEQNQTNAGQELQGQQVQFQRNQAYVQQQLSEKLQPLFSPVMVKRGANILMETGTTLAAASGLDVTNDLLVSLNAVLPTLVTTAPPPPAQPAAAAPARPARPAGPQPEGR